MSSNELLGHERGTWRYLDSYFDGTVFAGQETVRYDGEPRWALNYFGRIIRPDLAHRPENRTGFSESSMRMLKELLARLKRRAAL